MEIEVKTTKRNELVDITEIINECLNENSGNIENGIVHAFTPHATCGLTINENDDPNLPEDINKFLSNLVPQGNWKHDKIDGNADAHIKTSIIGNSVLIPFKNKNMKLGTWQNIFICEFDGPRRRKVILNIVESK